MVEPRVPVDLDVAPAAALSRAPFEKRVMGRELRDCAVDDAKTYEIRGAVAALQKALAQAVDARR